MRKSKPIVLLLLVRGVLYDNFYYSATSTILATTATSTALTSAATAAVLPLPPTTFIRVYCYQQVKGNIGSTRGNYRELWTYRELGTL